MVSTLWNNKNSDDSTVESSSSQDENNNHHITKHQVINVSTRKSIKSFDEIHVYFLVNPSSGGNQAGLLVDAGFKKTKSVIQIDGRKRKIYSYFYDMTKGTPGNRPAYHAIAKGVKEKRNIIACACGGDGSVVWMTTEIELHKIPHDKIYYAVIPYGTGNDFARAFGWEEMNAFNPFALVREREPRTIMFVYLFEMWFKATPCLMDIWDIELKLRPDGAVYQIKGPERVKQEVNVRKFKMFNYFSIGLDARIGMGFDRNRTTSQTANKMVYLNEGIKKAFMNDFITIDQWIHTFKENDKIIIDQTNKDSMRIKKGSKCLMALNVNSYGGGRELWEHSNRLGIDMPNKDKPNLEDLRRSIQRTGDEKIEWMTVKHRGSLGLEQVGKGHARRVHQGKGPFVLQMNQKMEAKDRCYFQVDGEFFQVSLPESFTLKRSKQVTVLANLDADFVDTHEMTTA